MIARSDLPTAYSRVGGNQAVAGPAAWLATIPKINLSLTIAVLIPLTIRGAAGRSVLVIARPRHGTIRAPACSLTVVGFGSFRGEADGGDGARLGGVAAARDDQSGSGRCGWFARLRYCSDANAGHSPDPAPPTERSAPALASRQPGNAAALSTAGPGDSPRGTKRRRPNAFTAPSRIGATPNYGSPNGLGEGDTGYNSANTPKSKKKKRAAQKAAAGSQSSATFAPVPTYVLPPPPPAPPPQNPPLPEVYPKNAARRPGAIIPPPSDELPVNNPPPEVHPLSAATRPGAALAVPPVEYFDYSATTAAPTLPPLNAFAPGMLPQKPLPFAGNDPFAPVGVRAGSFLLLPSVDLSGVYSTNPGHGSPTGPASAYFVAAPELQVASDWERHALTADIVGSYTQYASSDLVPSLNVPFLNSKIDGRVDVTRDTQILLENRIIVATDNPGSPNLQTQLAQLPINQDIGGTLGIAQQFNRLSFSLKGTIDRATYDKSLLTNGQTATNADRNFDQYAAILRVGYEIDPGMKPFLEVQEDERIHDEQFDRNGLQRNSVGTTVKLGSVIDIFGTVSGEMALGYLERNYQDPTLPNISGPIAAGALIWQATALTTAKLTRHFPGLRNDGRLRIRRIQPRPQPRGRSRISNLAHRRHEAWLRHRRLRRLRPHRQSLLCLDRRHLQIQPRMAGQDGIAAGLADRLAARQLLYGDIYSAWPALAAVTAR